MALSKNGKKRVNRSYEKCLQYKFEVGYELITYRHHDIKLSRDWSD